MKGLTGALCTLVLTAGAALAQDAYTPATSAETPKTVMARDVPNTVGASMGHWHLHSRDVDANRKIFVAMGGKAVKEGAFDIVDFPNVRVFLSQPNDPAPPTAGSEGSTVNHVGFLVKDLQAQTAQWKAAGVPVVPGRGGRVDQAFVTTPDGLKIEILEDKMQPEPIRNEHIHFFVPASEQPKMQEWYAKVFGAQTVTNREGRGRYVDIPGVQLRFAVSETPTVSTKGRVLDHIGFYVKDLEAFTKKLAADGVKIDKPYRKNPATGTALAFIYDPWGTYIELNEKAPAK